jgi:hypothetical protein
MALTKIDEYEVMYSANTFAPSIGLKNSNNFIATLYFRPNGSALPPDDMVNNQVLLYYHLEDYQNIVDLLRNDRSMYLLYNGSGGGFENGIQTTSEAVGAAEP